MLPQDHRQGHKNMTSFANQIINWQVEHGRNHLPWQKDNDPYRIWLSEIMLQQTGVKTVQRFYGKFLDQFPCLSSLSRATEDEVLRKWSGLGYYRRARNMLSAAKNIATTKNGKFPNTYEGLMALPGVGRSTAGAILVFAFGKNYPILDGNVKRVLARYFCIESPLAEGAVNKKLWQLSEQLLPKDNIQPYTQGLMDLGATICTKSKPKCHLCPLRRRCKTLKEGKCLVVPVRKKKSPTPVKETYMLITVNNGYLMMERRDYKGVWGGLLSFPEIGSQEQIRAWLADSDFKFINIKYLKSVTHIFSHYRAIIHPILAESEIKGKTFAGQSIFWLTYQDALEAAIPAAIRKIIRLNLQDLVDH